MMSQSPHTILSLPEKDWLEWLEQLYEINERLERWPAELPKLPKGAQAVDEYVLSAHAEAFVSTEVDGEIWQTYQDLELDTETEKAASTEAEAWQAICNFYLERGAVLIRVELAKSTEDSAEELTEEWLLRSNLLQRLEFPYTKAVALQPN